MSLLVFMKIISVQDPGFEKWFPHIRADNIVGFFFSVVLLFCILQ